MAELCTDNRFEMIEKYKKALIEGTNIETSSDEMKVIDNVLFRFWQMGWLEKLETTDVVQVVRCEKCKWQRKHLLNNGHFWYECGYGNESLGHDREFCSDGERREDGEV